MGDRYPQENEYDRRVRTYFQSKTFKTIITITLAIVGGFCLIGICIAVLMLTGIGGSLWLMMKSFQGITNPNDYPTIAPLDWTRPAPTPIPTWTKFDLADPIIWALSSDQLLPEMISAIDRLLISDPPIPNATYVYGVMSVDRMNGDWAISLANITDPDPPYNNWNAENNIDWFGTVICTQDQGPWTCKYYSP